LIGGLDRLRLDPREVLEARLFRPDDLPAGMPQAHRELVNLYALTLYYCLTGNGVDYAGAAD
jgi:hypothetical protein